MHSSIPEIVPPERAPGTFLRIDLSIHRTESLPELTAIPVGEKIQARQARQGTAPL
jgi:hypothetical protein